MVGMTGPAAPENGALRVVYTDLDGTLFGPGGSLFADPEGQVTHEPVEAVLALAEAGVELVPMSGRTRDQTRDVARLLGARTYGAELGALLVYRLPGGEELLQEYPAAAATPFERIHQSGAGGFLLERYAGRLEPHEPWSRATRECTILLRGQVDVGDANEALRASGNGWLELIDNGRLARGPERFPHLGGSEVRNYHLAPAGTSKGSAIARDRARRSLAREACAAIGDGPADVAMAAEVGTMFLVANGADAIPAEAANIHVTERPYGLGFADAVRALLAPAEP
jgi:hydroxymethylpyrimidine pyrophosphatase-like HAD family hydrolase